MTRYIKVLLAGAFIASSPVGASLAFDDAEKKELGEIIKQYLIENPEVLVEAQTVLEQRQLIAQQQRLKSIITDMADDIANNSDDIVFGNPDGDVTIVEFFDYNCGYCKRAMSDMIEIVEKDPNVKFVLKEFPILGPESVEATSVSIAVNRIAPEKSARFHTEMLGSSGRANKDKGMSIADSLGIDLVALEKELQDQTLLEGINKTYEIAQALEINGTPSYIVGEEPIFGAVGVSDILKKIQNMRSCGKATC
ncbi:DsbA family protein [Lentilitoribacter sp. EG35]|uniref:DsbA family protein n=1 Tax=Lentilitoribacter sp. EG35 TaxID=3234192 RepID=UPI00345FEDD8